VVAALQDFLKRVNLIAVLDHSGRGGNGFLLASFDQNPQALTCHWAHYLYSYLISEFGTEQTLDSAQAHDFILSKTKFGCVFKEMTEEERAFVVRIGGDPDVPVDRAAGLQAFSEHVLSRPSISRRDLVLTAYYAFAVATGRDPGQVAYVLTADAVSLRDESRTRPFSGQIIREIIHDFPQAKCINLVRDPRAVFASNRHQFVNVNGNMYGLKPGCALRRLAELLRLDLNTEGCVFLHWIVYCTSAAKTIYALKNEYAANFITLRNEDLNLRFEATLRGLCRWLAIPFWEPWADPAFAPTSLGSPWQGVGAYNNAYQQNRFGPLKNDPDSVSKKVTGPNAYVTERWKTRLSANEIAILEVLFRDEMRDLDYAPLRAQHGQSFLTSLCLPFKGELPSLAWLKEGAGLGWRELGNRLFYALALPPYYVLARLALLGLYRQGYFHNPQFKTRRNDAFPGEPA